MNRTPLIFGLVTVLALVAVVYFLVARSSLKTSSAAQTTNSAATGGDNWRTRMGWRYVIYVEKGDSLSLLIEPMVEGDDRVYVPDEASWSEHAPAWAWGRRAEILGRLKSVAWNRKVAWKECQCPFSPSSPDKVPPGSLESTPGGRALEADRLFESGSQFTPDEARLLWHEAARRYAEQAKGEVTIAAEVVPGSVLEAIVLPTLKKNPNVTTIIK